MKQTLTILAGALWIATRCLSAEAEGKPKIQFDQTLYDFGKTSQVSAVSGVFKFRNTGDGILKVEPPKPSCGCTIAELKPDTLPPGATGELRFTIDPYMAYRKVDDLYVMHRCAAGKIRAAESAGDVCGCRRAGSAGLLIF
jgi:hypothetical protein